MTKVDEKYIRSVGDYIGNAKLKYPLLIVAIETNQPEVVLVLTDGSRHTIKIEDKIQGIGEPLFVCEVESKGKVTLYRPIELPSQIQMHKHIENPEEYWTRCRDPYCAREHITINDTEIIYRLIDKDEM